MRQSFCFCFLTSILSLIGTLICPSVASSRVGPAASPPPPAPPPLALSFSSLTAAVVESFWLLASSAAPLAESAVPLALVSAAQPPKVNNRLNPMMACLTPGSPRAEYDTIRDAKTYRLVEPLVKRA